MVIGKVEVLPSGALRIPGRLTRTGVLVYKRADGTEQRELRLPEEVFHADSLATLRAAAVTDLHPRGQVTPDNWQHLSVGTVGDDVRRDGETEWVAASVIVARADAIGKVQSGERSELSCGYACTIDETPGEWNGERYDAVQRGITYNHLAILPKGTARAGSGAALRLDSDGHEIAPVEEPPKKEQVKMKKVRIDGRTFELEDDVASAFERHDAEKDAEIASLTSKATEATKRADKAEARADAAEAEVKTATSPEAMAERVRARTKLVTDARKLAGADFKVDGKTDEQVRADAIAAVNGADFVKDKSADYIESAFDYAVSRTDADGGNSTREDGTIDDGLGPDADNFYPKRRADGAGDKLPEPPKPAWQQPTAIHRPRA